MRTTILFDAVSGADYPVARFRAICFKGGEPPEFLPTWKEVDRVELIREGAVAWRRDSPDGPTVVDRSVVPLEPRNLLGAIDGFFYRHCRRRMGKVFAPIAWDSPGSWADVRALYQMFEKHCPWRLRRLAAPGWAIEEVKL